MASRDLANLLEAALLAAGRPLGVDEILGLLEQGGESPGREGVQAALDALAAAYADRGIELRQVASGYRIQVRADYARRLGGLFAERPARYSRALLETLALVAWRQPLTRGEIEDIRGVSVSSSIMKTLLEREWVRVVGHRDVPGRPALYGTTRQFLDYFNLRSLADLPSLAELRDLDLVSRDLFGELGPPEDGQAAMVAADPDGSAPDADGEAGGEDGEAPPNAGEAPAGAAGSRDTQDAPPGDREGPS